MLRVGTSKSMMKKTKNALRSLFSAYFALAPKRLATPVLEQPY
jgi:hypothetical protein